MSTQNQAAGASMEAIQHHYDVSNQFYETWLDPRMVYSCAMWDEGDTLEAAQLRKLDYHINAARVADAGRVLDVGCGWGGLMERMVSGFGVKEAVGLTLSAEQLKKVEEKNIPQISAQLQSWEDHHPDKPYDGIISIGAFEHFATTGLTVEEREARYRKFFEKCHAILKPGAYLSLQTIACGNMLREDFSEFFKTEIFPESDLPRASEIFNASEFLFEPVTMRNDGLDYARTVREWKSNMKRNKEAAISASSPEVYARYEKYFNLVILSFETFKTMYLYRIAFKKIDKPRKM